MGALGKDHGSEYHFLRYRRERPQDLDKMLLKGLGAPDGSLEWVYPANRQGENEPQGLAFLRDRPDVIAAWKKFWPTSGRQRTWDGVAKLHRGDSVDWVLIEAKANAVEFVTPPCGAVRSRKTEGDGDQGRIGGFRQIEKALGKVKTALGVHRHYPWTGTYYQYATRLAVLHFLNHVGKAPSRLLHVYFTGDKFPDGRECPEDKAAWVRFMEARDITLGLRDQAALAGACHSAFIPVLHV